MAEVHDSQAPVPQDPLHNPEEPTHGIKKEPKEKKAKAPKEPKEPKEPKVKKERDPNAVTRPRLPKFPHEHIITVLRPGSKSRGAAERFNFYATGQTVKQYVDIMTTEFTRTEGKTQDDMRWDHAHGFINIGPTVIDIPAPAPAPVQTAAPASAPAA